MNAQVRLVSSQINDVEYLMHILDAILDNTKDDTRPEDEKHDHIYSESAKTLAECGKIKMAEEVLRKIRDWNSRSTTKYIIEDRLHYGNNERS